MKRFKTYFFFVVLLNFSVHLFSESVLNFPRLSFEPNTLTGIAIVNPTDTDATVTITAYGKDGQLLSGPGFRNPVQIQITARRQYANLTSGVFEGSLGASQIGWFQATSPVDNLTGFFVFLDGAITIFDGADLPDVGSKIVFNQVRVDGGASTELNIINTHAAASAKVDLQLFGAGAAPPAKQIEIPARGMARLDAATFFEVKEVSSGAYVIATSKVGIAGFEFVAAPNRDMLGLNARRLTDQLNTLYFPQMAVLGPWETELGLVNYSSSPVIATITAFQPDGKPYGTANLKNNPVTRQLPTSGSLRENVATMFGFAGNTPQVGWIRVESTAKALNGYISYGLPSVGSVAAVATAAQGRTRALFSHNATTFGYFTGIAILNPAALAANIRVVAMKPSGEILGVFDGVIQPGHRISNLITELIPQADGQAGGLIWIKSDLPVYLTSLFGTNKVLANIPPQDAPPGYQPDKGQTSLKLQPPMAIVPPGSEQAFRIQGLTSGSVVWRVNGTAGGTAETGTVDVNGVYKAPSNVPSSLPVTLTAETPGRAVGATVDVLRKDRLIGDLGIVQSVAYLDTLKKLFTAELAAASALGEGLDTASREVAKNGNSQIFEVSPAAPKLAIAAFAGEDVVKMIPFSASDGKEYLLLAGKSGGRIIRLDPATRQSKDVVTGLNQPAALVFDPVSGNLLVAEKDKITEVPRLNLEAGLVRAASRSPLRGGPLLTVASIAGATGLAVDACSGDLYFSDSTAGAIRVYGRLTRQTRTVASDLKNPTQLLDAYRKGTSCPSSFQLFFTEPGAQRVALLIPEENLVQSWVAARGVSDIAFLPRGTPFSSTEGVLFPESVGTDGGQLSVVPTPQLYSSSPINKPRIPPIGDYSDPVGDVFGGGEIKADITRFSVVVKGSDLVISVSFADAIEPPDSQKPNAIQGITYIDSDQSLSTGFDLQFNDMGIDLLAMPLTSREAFVFRIVFQGGEIVQVEPQTVPVVFTANSYTISIPLSFIGKSNLKPAAFTVTIAQSSIDFAPNEIFLSSATE